MSLLNAGQPNSTGAEQASKVKQGQEDKITTTCSEIVHKIHDVVLADRRVSGRHIASTLGISQKGVHSCIEYE